MIDLSGNLHIRWARWNAFKEGEEISRYGDMWYRDSILYANDTPAQRMVPGPNGFVILHKYSPLPMVPIRNYLAGASVPIDSVRVPDLAVFSDAPDDWLDGDAMHDRVRFIIFSKVRLYAERTIMHLSGKFLETSEWKRKELIGGFDHWVSMYATYARVFKLGWSPLPSMYRDDMLAMIKAKRDAWMDPRAVAKRERVAARKEAVQALTRDLE